MELLTPQSLKHAKVTTELCWWLWRALETTLCERTLRDAAIEIFNSAHGVPPNETGEIKMALNETGSV